MKLRFVVSVMSVVGLALVACGGSSDLSSLCGQAQECAVKAGAEFSKTKCENDAKVEAEKADTAGCGDQYGDLANCITGLDLQCSDDLGRKISAECGKEDKAYRKCID